jgi:hypothetical protein
MIVDLLVVLFSVCLSYVFINGRKLKGKGEAIHVTVREGS